MPKGDALNVCPLDGTTVEGADAPHVGDGGGVFEGSPVDSTPIPFKQRARCPRCGAILGRDDESQPWKVAVPPDPLEEP